MVYPKQKEKEKVMIQFWQLQTEVVTDKYRRKNGLKETAQFVEPISRPVGLIKLWSFAVSAKS